VAGWPRRTATFTAPVAMTIGCDPVAVTDRDVDALAWQFLNSDYVGDAYAQWRLDRRLDGFLRLHGLHRLADNGDICNILLGRVVAYRKAGLWPSAPRQLGQLVAAARRSHPFDHTSSPGAGGHRGPRNTSTATHENGC
jgi:hypothetical protein